MPNDTDSMWEKWGEQNPYYGVVSEAQYSAENLEQHKDKFFETGAVQIDRVLQDLGLRYGFAARGSALDFGCGVGRLVVPLASRFERVDGIDVSPSMLKEAAVNVEGRGLRNVTLHSSDDGLTALAGKQYDLVHTYNVFQHIPTARGYVLIENLLSHVAPGGAFFIHASLQKRFTKLGMAAYYAKHRIPFAYPLFNLLQGRPLLTPTMQMNDYHVEDLLPLFQKYGFGDVAVRADVHPARAGSVLTAVFYSAKS